MTRRELEQMAQALMDVGGLQSSEQESIVRAILKREEMGSTGIGRGVAVPHTKHPSVDQLVGSVAISHDGVDFDSSESATPPVLTVTYLPPTPTPTVTPTPTITPTFEGEITPTPTDDGGLFPWLPTVFPFFPTDTLTP